MERPTLRHITTLPLRHNGDCTLIGVAPNFNIYVEEIYSEDGWMAQHVLNLDGQFIASVDEDSGAVTDIDPLPLPEDIARPHTGWHTMHLNFSGPRHRGLRGPERAPDMVRPLTMPEKMLLIDHFKLDILPPMIMGLAESYVLAEAPLTRPDLFIVCRRVRVAYQLMNEAVDQANQPYDYDTLVLYLTHPHHRGDDEPPLSVALQGIEGANLSRPMDCLITDGHLFIAEGGHDDQLSSVHVWEIDYPEAANSDKDLNYL
jgi:hypothetical protein